MNKNKAVRTTVKRGISLDWVKIIAGTIQIDSN
jgi:hypothetical protein